MSAQEVIAYIADAADQIAAQAGVGAMETAGSIVSYLAAHPGRIEDFMAGGSVLDWPPGWHEHGCLSWHGMNGGVFRPEQARRQRIIKRMEGST